MKLFRVYVNGHYTLDSLSNTKDKICRGTVEVDKFVKDCESEFRSIEHVYSRIITTCDCGNEIECFFEDGTRCGTCGKLYDINGDIMSLEFGLVTNN